ncbi:hypothetical protein FOMPIDRAFT_94381, partial [Fomitopsis schrenkii]
MPSLQSVSYLSDEEPRGGVSECGSESMYFSCENDSVASESSSDAELIVYDKGYEDQYLPPVKEKGTYGHHLGDAYASHAARVLNRAFRELYPHRDEDDADICVVRTSDAKYTVSYWELSREIGVAYLRDPETDICGWCFPWIDQVMGNELDYGEIP